MFSSAASKLSSFPARAAVLATVLLLGSTSPHVSATPIAVTHVSRRAASPYGVLSPISLLDPVFKFMRPGSNVDVEFEHCKNTDLQGVVEKIDVAPCGPGEGSLDRPCVFKAGANYKITITFVPNVSSQNPRSNLIAYDHHSNPPDYYPYSGQSFAGCQYTTCPVLKGKRSVYEYGFHTLESGFDYLVFNVTESLTGPSFLCAGFPIDFEEN